MCLEDIRLMRHTTSDMRNQTVTTTSAQLVPFDPNRVTLIISAPDANDIILSIAGDASATNGFRLNAGSNPLILTLMLHGDIVTKAFNAITAAATESICVVTTSFIDGMER